MDSNAAQFSREDDKGCQLVPAATAEEPSRPQGSGPQAASGEAAPGCPGNTQGESSHTYHLEGFPEYLVNGGIDWFEWTALIRWNDEGPFLRSLVRQFEVAKLKCQEHRKRFVEVFIPDFGSVRVARIGVNRGKERGQHYEFRLSVAGATIGLSSRQPGEETSLRRNQSVPNLFVKQTGRDCLLVGPCEIYDQSECLISALGGEVIEHKLSRADLCLDVSNLDARDLHALVQNGHFVTRASDVRPAINYVTNKITGFCAGKSPLYLTVYDKIAERLGKADHLYNQALIDRRWYGVLPNVAARIEFQMCRSWLLEKGITTPKEFLDHRGTLIESLTSDWFRITERRVDRRRKHQSRSKTHPLWTAIQRGFATIFGPPEGPLPSLKRHRVTPFELAAQARGCIAACLLQMGVDVRSYRDFANKGKLILLRLFPKDEERLKFLQEFDRRKMEFETL